MEGKPGKGRERVRLYILSRRSRVPIVTPWPIIWSHIVRIKRAAVEKADAKQRVTDRHLRERTND